VKVTRDFQAGSENVSGSTFSERKIMSTKTSFKRIAAVAAVALTLGGLSAVSASANTTQADTLAISASSSSTTVGTPTKIYVTQTFLAPDAGAYSDTLTATAYVTSAPAYNAALPVFSAGTAGTLSDVNATSSVGGTPQVINVSNTGTGPSYVAGNNTLTFTPAVAGTYTILIKQSNNTTNTQAASLTWTITVAANASASAAFSKAWMIAGAPDSCGAGCYYAHAFQSYVDATNPTALEDTAAAALSSSSISVSTTPALAGTYVANIAVFERNNAIGFDNTAAAPITASISGPGYVGIGNHAVLAKSVTESTSASGSDGYGSKTKSVYVVADGTTGTATVTISAGGVTLATRTVVFYGSAATAKATNNISILNSNGSGALNGAAEIYIADASGNPVANAEGTIKATSSDLTVLNSSAVGAANCTADAVAGTGYYYCDVTTTPGQITSGKSATITFYVMSGSTVKATSNALTFTTGDVRAEKLVLSTDSDTYAPGEKVTLTLTATDANGNPVADYDGTAAQSITVFAADKATGNLSTSAAVTTPVFTTAIVKFAGGKATATFYAPYTTGNVVLSAVLAGTLGGAKTASLSAALVGTTLSKTIVVTAPTDVAAQAAIDAAQEATDAANAAYDAANNAMDSADAATAAAQDASDNASAALAAVTSLSATVAKLVQSVASIAAALAKIQKKLKA